MFTERAQIKKIGEIVHKDGAIFLLKDWHFDGATVVDKDNKPLSTKEMRKVKLGRFIRAILGYKLSNFLRLRRRATILIADWTPEEIIALSNKQ